VGGGRALEGLVLAFRFLTLVPVPGREAEGTGALGRAGWWFPVVGLGLGLVLAVADRVLAWVFPPLLGALLVVSLWKVLTGGIHLDGLADCLDGLAGRDVAQRLAIMRDSRVGVYGALGIVVVFLVSLVVLAELPQWLRAAVLVLAPVTGRIAPLLAGALLPAATPLDGIGGAFVASVSRAAGPVLAAGVLALAGALVGVWAMAAVVAGLGLALLGSALVARRLGGITGDGLGASVELGELGVLLAAAAQARLGGV
jgi:adenosylcobinamide-GDP ribazoletransferase